MVIHFDLTALVLFFVCLFFLLGLGVRRPADRQHDLVAGDRGALVGFDLEASIRLFDFAELVVPQHPDAALLHGGVLGFVFVVVVFVLWLVVVVFLGVFVVLVLVVV